MLFVHSHCCQQYCLPLSRLIAGLFSLHHHIVQSGSQPVTMMPNNTVASCFQQKSVSTNMFQPVCSIWRSIRCVAGIMYRMNPVHSKFKKSLNLVVFWSNSLFSQSFPSNIQFKENSLTHSTKSSISLSVHRNDSFFFRSLFLATAFIQTTCSFHAILRYESLHIQS